MEKNNQKDDLKFEIALKRIEEIVEKLEKETDLEESLKLYEEGMKLIKLCEKMINNAKAKVEIITKTETGFILEPFDEGEGISKLDK